jgi:hypothetical protein
VEGWNRLPEQVKTTESTDKFKEKLQQNEQYVIGKKMMDLR